MKEDVVERFARVAAEAQAYGACWLAGLMALALVLAALSGNPLLS
jgi:hypothetical protein